MLALGAVSQLLTIGACNRFSTAIDGVADPSRSESVHLVAEDVRTIIAQAATEAQRSGLAVTIAVVDHQGVVLGVLQMAGANPKTKLAGGGTGGFEGDEREGSAVFAAISKAGTGAFFSTQGNAFSTRTASYIVQEHFPPLVDPSPGGPLFGVQLSNLRCSDVDRGSGAHRASSSNLPFGLAADPGGLPLYKDGVAVGGLGVEGDGIYTLDRAPLELPSVEEAIALAGARGFETPAAIRADQIFVDGIRLVFARAEPPPMPASVTPYATFAAAGKEIVPPSDGFESAFEARTLGGVDGEVPESFAKGFSSSNALGTDDVERILGQGAVQANRTRAAIRLPIGSNARVNIAVVDARGTLLGLFRTIDAPIFGFDVSVQKARTAAFFSSTTAASTLSMNGLSTYAQAAAADGLPLDGSTAYSTRAIGFLSQPIYPPGAILPYANGPFSEPIGTWSIFDTGLHTSLYRAPLGSSLTDAPCAGPGIRRLQNGITIFPGGVPLYKGTVLVGGVGVSGDGVDQDDLITVAASLGFEAPIMMRCDQLTVRGAALPYSVSPRHPDL
jgi:uncharacterized protein GlcG (DUF336 family)